MANLRAAVLSQALALAALAAPAALQGQEVHCVRERAHLVRFDVAGEPSDGSSLQGVERAVISVEPSPAHAEHCRGRLGAEPSGDKQFCYGVNQDSSCAAAKSVVPLEDGLDCKDCFVSVEADAFYKLNYSMTQLNSVEVGLRDIHLRASAGLHAHKSGSGAPAGGSLTLPGSDKPYTLIDRLVGCPVCVRVTIKVGAPTSLDYKLAYKGEVDVEAGASLDVQLGDNFVHYEKVGGWAHETHDPKVVVKPLLTVSSSAEATLALDVKTSLQVNVDNIVWYHLNLDPSLPLKIAFDGGFGPFSHAKVCVDGDAAFNMAQEANLDWSLLTWHEKDHWGPQQLFSWSKQGVVHACKEVGANASAALVV